MRAARGVKGVLITRGDPDNVFRMSFTEIKDGVRELSVEQRLEIAALIVHLNRVEDDDWRHELDKRLDAMEAGRKVGQSDLQQLHQELSSRGR